MKKIILALIIATSAIASFGQVYQVIDSKLIDNPIVRQKVQLSFDNTQREQRIFKVQMQKEDRLYDTIYFKAVIDSYINQKWNVHYSLVDYFSVPDTIIIEKIDTQYYLDGDITQVSLNYERDSLITKYNRLKSLYGELVTYDINFRPIKERYDTLVDWLSQIQSQ